MIFSRRLKLCLVSGLLALAVMAPMARAETPAAASTEEAASVREAYLAASERGDATTAYSMHNPGLQALESEAQFASHIAQLNAVLGPLIERQITRTTVYTNPPGVDPGVYVAFDMIGRFENADRYCGYIIIFQPPAGAPKVARIEQNFLLNASADQTTRNAGQPSADQVWTQMATQNCPGWAPPV